MHRYDDRQVCNIYIAFACTQKNLGYVGIKIGRNLCPFGLEFVLYRLWRVQNVENAHSDQLPSKCQLDNVTFRNELERSSEPTVYFQLCGRKDIIACLYASRSEVEGIMQDSGAQFSGLHHSASQSGKQHTPSSSRQLDQAKFGASSNSPVTAGHPFPHNAMGWE